MSAQATKLAQQSFVPLYADSLHDLASPINQICTMFDLYLRRQQQQPAGDDGILNLIRESAGRLRRLMDALQEYDRVAGGPPQVRTCEGNALLAIALAVLDPMIRESNASIQFADLPRLDCDPNQISYAFTALIGNAIKFRSEAQPEIRIAADSQADHWLFSFRDNGMGIDARHHESVFHMFKRLHSDRYPGAGAGLAITRRVVERHGGRIWVQSEPGGGSSFFFTLPSGPW